MDITGRPAAGGMVVGVEICALGLGGDGGVKGILAGGAVTSEFINGDRGMPGYTGPGGGGVADTAVLLSEPGNTDASESKIVGFVLPSCL